MESLQQQELRPTTVCLSGTLRSQGSQESCNVSAPSQVATQQNAAAGLTLLQQTMITSHPFTPQMSMQVGGTAAAEHPANNTVWSPFSAIPSMTRTQRKAARKAARLLEANGLAAQPVSPIDLSGRQFNPSDIGNVFMNNGDIIQQSLQQVMRVLPSVPNISTPKTYPYTQNIQRSPITTPSLSPLLQGSQSCGILCQPSWDQPKPAKLPNLYNPNVSVSPSGIWLSPSSPHMSFSDSALETLQTPQQKVSEKTMLSACNGCPVTRNEFGSVIPSIDVIPCQPYIPPKCPETLTEAACMYIDYLIQENENLVHTSHCEFLQPFTKREHREFIQEILQGPCQMPSEKFRAWLKQFNVDVEVVTGEMNPSGEMDDDLGEFDASLFLPDISESQPKKSQQPEETNLTNLLPQLVSREENDGSITIHCIQSDGIQQEEKSIATPIPIHMNPGPAPTNEVTSEAIPRVLQNQLGDFTASANNFASTNVQCQASLEDENSRLALFSLLENFQNQGMSKVLSAAEIENQPVMMEHNLTEDSEQSNVSSVDSSESPEQSVLTVDKSTQCSTNPQEPGVQVICEPHDSVQDTEDCSHSEAGERPQIAGTQEACTDTEGLDSSPSKPEDPQGPSDLSIGLPVEYDVQNPINSSENHCSLQISVYPVQNSEEHDMATPVGQHTHGKLKKLGEKRMEETQTLEPANGSSLSNIE